MKFFIKEIKIIDTKLNNKCSNERMVKINVHYLSNNKNLTDKEYAIIKDLQKIPIHIFVNFPEPLFKQLCYLEKERVATFITALHWFYKIRFNKKAIISKLKCIYYHFWLNLFVNLYNITAPHRAPRRRPFIQFFSRAGL